MEIFICFWGFVKRQPKRLAATAAAHLISLSILNGCMCVARSYVDACECILWAQTKDRKKYAITSIWQTVMLHPCKTIVKCATFYGWYLFRVHSSCLCLQHDTSALSRAMHTHIFRKAIHTISFHALAKMNTRWLLLCLFHFRHNRLLFRV